MNKALKEFFQWLNEAKLGYTVYDDPWFITFRLRVGQCSKEFGIKETDDTFSIYQINSSGPSGFDEETKFLFFCNLNAERGYWTLVDFIANQVNEVANLMCEKNSFLVVQETKVAVQNNQTDKFNVKNTQTKFINKNHLLMLLHASSHISVFDKEYPDEQSPLTKNVVVYVKPTKGYESC